MQAFYNKRVKMLRYVLVAALFSVGVANCEIQFDFGLVTVQNLTEYLMKNPDVKALQPMEKSDVARSQIRYTLGGRVNGKWKND